MNNVLGTLRNAATDRLGRPRVSPGVHASARPGTDATYPLSFGQERVWLLDKWQGHTAVHHRVAAIGLRGRLDRKALGRGLDELARRHEALRATIVDDPANPRQRVRETIPIDCRNLASTDLDDLVRAQAQEVFDLTKGPLLRATTLAVGPGEHVLVLAFHAISGDAASADIMSAELPALYGAAVEGRPSGLPVAPFGFPEFAARQRELLRGQEFEERLARATERLRGAPQLLEIPTDRSRPAEQTFDGQRLERDLTRLAPALGDLSRALDVPTFTIMVTAFGIVLGRYADVDDFVLGLELSGRKSPSMSRVVGSLADATVLRIDLSGNPAFRDAVDRVQQEIATAESYADIPFARLVQSLHPARSASYSPVFQVLVTRAPAPPGPQTVGGLTFTPLAVHTGTTAHDLTLTIADSGTLRCALEYNVDLFERDTIQRMLGHLQQVLDAAVANSPARISEFSILTAEERRQLLIEWNQTTSPYPAHLCVDDLVDDQTHRTPDAIAVADGVRSIRYSELVEASNQLARRLRGCGVGPNVLVGVCLDRSVELVIALLAVWKAGGAYVPLDASYPRARLAFMMSDAGLRSVVTSASLARALQLAPEQTIDIDRQDALSPFTDPSPRRRSSDDLAYVIYTSGSTGQPKGVQIPHRTLVNFLVAMESRPGLTAADRLLAVTTLAFDIAGLELWLPLIAGARVELVGREVAADGRLLLAAAGERQATVLQATPATWQMLIDAGWEGHPPLRVWCGGEALSPELAAGLCARSGSIWNLYGPTETTIWSAAQEIRATTARVPIGGPIANTQLYVLDGCQQPVPIGVPGELYIGGAGVARGYLNRPDLTATRFIRNRFSSDVKARLYRTGDRVRYRADGTLEYLGRFDHQVKVRGFRIELGEIEATLTSHPKVTEAVVALSDSGAGDRRLVAYVGGPKLPSANELRNWVEAALPDYMVPRVFVPLDKLPRTPNGKVDRRALPYPELKIDAGESRPPQTAVERELASLWRELLHVDSIDLRDNFFELGGHSLVAVRLFARIESQFDARLPLATLLEAPTLGQLANVLERRTPERAWSSLVVLQPRGTRRPFFCVHGAGANVVYLRALAAYLGTDQPFYGLQSQGLDGTTPPHRRVEDMAAHYIREIVAVQREGPYLLGGFSFGGVVAFEMAQQLSSQGERVDLVALVDTFFPGPPRHPARRTAFSTTVYPIAWRLEHALNEMARLGTLGYLRTWEESVKRRIERAARVIVPEASFEGWDISESLRRVIEANLEAERHYVPRPYGGRLVLFRGSGERVLHDDARLEWDQVANAGLEVLVVPGDHNTLREEPHVAVLAAVLRAQLARADRGRARCAS